MSLISPLPTFIWSLKSLHWTFTMSVCFFNLLSNGEYSKILIVAVLSNSPFSGKTSSAVKNSYFPTFPDYKEEISVVSMSKSYGALFLSILLLGVLIFSLTVIL